MSVTTLPAAPLSAEDRAFYIAVAKAVMDQARMCREDGYPAEAARWRRTCRAVLRLLRPAR